MLCIKTHSDNSIATITTKL